MGFNVGTIGLTVEGEPERGEWIALFGSIKRDIVGRQFALGDLIRYGKQRGWIHDLAALARSQNWSARSMNIYVWVAASVRLANRQPTLSFKHHEIVAALSDAEQATLLQRCVDEHWSAGRLARHLNGGDMPGRLAAVFEVSDLARFEAGCSALESLGIHWQRIHRRLRRPIAA